MLSTVKTYIKKIKYWVDQLGFEPYIKPFQIKDITGRFYYGNIIAKQWYDPIRPLPKLEYEWALANINLQNQKILDGGCHHGHYSVFFVLASQFTCDLVSIDAISANLLLTEINLLLNGYTPKIIECAIYNSNEMVHFENISNGKILLNRGIIVPSHRLSNIMPEANVIKLDIEGAEFEVLPDAIDKLSKVHTWIVEIHPKGRSPDEIVNLFIERNYVVEWLNPREERVEQYQQGSMWKFHHTTIFALK